MGALVSANIQRLVRLSTRHSIFNPVSKPPNCLHAIPSSCFGNNSSSNPQSRIVTIPNILTSLRIGATPSIFFLILKQDLSSAAILAAVIGLTDAVRTFTRIESSLMVILLAVFHHNNPSQVPTWTP
ncbi:hypothetical protein EmuJ_000435830 [Echinococcus multilocularis]|uniref:Uncharacterized protein n=1 Tax=Echinococcus multilocularis TaxID=6211 RepID=A0A068Y203_ECHMU|nr:hypothetical protein EmuJ_000435830 [Echinococcus multilocularis]